MMFPLITTFAVVVAFSNWPYQRVSASSLGGNTKGWSGLDIRSHHRARHHSFWVSHRVKSALQCVRLCWLFKACTSITFTGEEARCELYNSVSGTDDVILVRDTKSVVVGIQRATFSKERVKRTMRNRGCDSRPCKETEMCAPVRNKANYVCLPLVAVFCPDNPPVIANSENYPDGVISVIYACAPYYHRSGTVFVSQCDRSTKRWSALDMTCNFVDCGTPPQVEGASFSGVSTFYEAEVIYSCLDGGASPSASMSITCLASGQWTDPPGSCVLVSCGIPPIVQNTIPQLQRRSLTGALPGLTEVQLAIAVGGTITFTCKPGYESSPGVSYSSQCQADGQWSPTDHVTCTPAECGYPPLLPNSYRQSTPYTTTPTPPQASAPIAATLATTFGSYIYYHCHAGYTFKTLDTASQSVSIISSATLTCGVNGTWDLADTVWNPIPDVDFTTGCLPVDCGPPPGIEDARVDYNSTLSSYTAIYTCIEPAVSTIENNNNVITCDTSAQWSIADLTCQRIPCGAAPDVNNSDVVYTYDTSLQSFFATFSCESGYIAGSDIMQIRCHEPRNEWDQFAVLCKEINCGPAPAIAHASVVETGQTLMENAMYTCHEGYALAAVAVGGDRPTVVTRTCTDRGAWSTEIVSCEAISCSTPALPTNALMNSSSQASYSYGDVVAFTCISPHVLMSSNNSQVTCTENGWRQDIPGEEIVCVELACGAVPSVANAESLLRHLDSPMVVVYTCLLGYTLVDAAADRKICLTDGYIREWSNDPVVCEPVDCGQPSEPNEGTRVLAPTTTYGAVAVYLCLTGYTPVNESVDSVVSVCDENGNWSAGHLNCERLDCGVPPDWANAALNFNSTTYSSVASYMCEEGYVPQDWESACLASGEWDVTNFPNCSLIDCGHPENVTNGVLNFSSTLLNSTASYHCEGGYFVFGNSSDDTLTTIETVCQKDGHWHIQGLETSTQLFCNIIRCPDPPTISHAEPVVSNTSSTREVNSTVSYSCTNGFQLIGKNVLTCQEDLNWSYPFFECIEINCGVPHEVQNAGMTFSTTTVGSIVTFTCNENYQAVDNALQKTCLPSGRWSDNLIECVNNETVSCGAPPDVEHATKRYSSTTLLSGAMYTCDPGYEHTWLNAYVCASTGYWLSPLVLCEPIDCGAPPYIQLATNESTSTKYGAISRYECEIGTRSVFGSTKTCTVNGTWSEDFVECIYTAEESCGTPKGIENSHMPVFNGSKNGSVAVFHCDGGYEGSPFTVKCIHSSWVIPPSASCKPVDCGHPPTLYNAMARVSGTTFGSVVKYECLPGLVHTGASLKTCGKNKLWSGNVVECVPVASTSCGDPPHIDNTEMEFSSRQPGSFALYNCSDGYTGFVQINCQESGQWDSPKFDNCAPVSCDLSPSNPLHDIISLDNTFGYIWAFVCHPGYSPTRPLLTQCLTNGEWSAAQGKCTKVEENLLEFCPTTAPDVQNSSQTIASTHVGSIMSYTCSHGFMPFPYDLKRTCLPNLQWSDQPMRCESTICLQKPTVPNAILDAVLVKENDLFSLTAVYTCVEGYSTVSDAVNDPNVSPKNSRIERECNLISGWRESTAQCLPVRCGSLPTVTGATVKLISADTTFGSEVQFECQAPYHQNGASNSSMCQSNGMWSDVEMVCAHCDQTPQSPVPNSTLSLVYSNFDPVALGRVYSSSQISDQAELSCDDWFYFIGNSRRFQCTSVNGEPQWVGDDVICAQVYWKNPDPDPEGTHFLLYPEAFSDRLTVCTNFTYIGDERIIFSIENKTGNITTSPARVLWYDNFSRRKNYLRFSSKKADDVWKDSVVMNFKMDVGSEANFCLILDVASMKAQFLHNGNLIAEMPILPDSPYRDMREVKLMYDVEISELRITYE